MSVARNWFSTASSFIILAQFAAAAQDCVGLCKFAVDCVLRCVHIIQHHTVSEHLLCVQAARADNFYHPPDWDPQKGNLDKVCILCLADEATLWWSKHLDPS
jgi:hypothetical protein